MSHFKPFRLAVCAALCLLGVGTASAGLHDRGGGLIFDDVLNITWLKDANYAYTSGYSTANGGRMNWDDARSWAANLNYGGYTDWRLPTVSPVNGSTFVYGDLPSHPSNSYSGLTDLGFNVAGPQSEMGYMFYVNLGNTGQFDTEGNSQPDYNNVNSGPFINLQHYFYWFGTEYEYASNNFPNSSTFCEPPTFCAWDFVVGYGDQTIYQKHMEFYAWAVRDGDVSVPRPVPLDIKPQACPNRLNVKSRGVLPVAILGTADFDVETIDSVSIRLEGVAAIRSALEDVATPFEPPLNGEVNASNCTEQGPDGFTDLTLKFDTQEIVGALGDVLDGEALILTLTATLQDGTPIEGVDVVVIKKKGKE